MGIQHSDKLNGNVEVQLCLTCSLQTRMSLSDWPVQVWVILLAGQHLPVTLRCLETEEEIMRETVVSVLSDSGDFN